MQNYYSNSYCPNLLWNMSYCYKRWSFLTILCGPSWLCHMLNMSVGQITAVHNLHYFCIAGDSKLFCFSPPTFCGEENERGCQEFGNFDTILFSVLFPHRFYCRMAASLQLRQDLLYPQKFNFAPTLNFKFQNKNQFDLCFGMYIYLL